MKIPRDCDGADLIKALRKYGYSLVRQTGSHMIATTNLGGEHHITIPYHRPLKVGTLQNILKAVAHHHGTTVETLLRDIGF